MGGMHSVDLVDETFIAAPGEIAARVVADPERWLAWWPKRRLEVFMDRGIKGQRWSIAGDLVGSAEIWLEAYRDGVVLHYYLRADPPDAVPGGRPHPAAGGAVLEGAGVGAEGRAGGQQGRRLRGDPLNRCRRATGLP
jgi:hypothetical protein